MTLSKLNSYTHKYIYNSPLTEIPIQSERPYLNRNVLPVRSGIALGYVACHWSVAHLSVVLHLKKTYSPFPGVISGQ